MTAATASPRVRQVIALAGNLLLGVPAVVPLWLFWYMAVNWPLAATGLATRDATETDGILPWLLLGGPVVIASVLLWWLANHALRRWSAAQPRLYWPVMATATLVPTFTLALTGLRN